jgi:hypothetical protein
MNEHRDGLGPGGAGLESALESDARPTPRVLIRIAVGAALLAASILAVLLASGCGGQQSREQASVAGEAREAVVAQHTPAPSVPASNEDPVRTELGAAVTSADSLPPDVEAASSDSLVIPGEAVEITATASSDAVNLTLWDGIGRKQPFSYDSANGVWRVFYRVPLKGKTERLGLSVTAWNGAHRWRRVWVFLNVLREERREEKSKE